MFWESVTHTTIAIAGGKFYNALGKELVLRSFTRVEEQRLAARQPQRARLHVALRRRGTSRRAQKPEVHTLAETSGKMFFWRDKILFPTKSTGGVLSPLMRVIAHSSHQ